MHNAQKRDLISMEDIIASYGKREVESIIGKSVNVANENDDALETISESDIPVRPPRPSKNGMKLFKNLSLNKIGNYTFTFVFCLWLAVKDVKLGLTLKGAYLVCN